MGRTEIGYNIIIEPKDLAPSQFKATFESYESFARATTK